jgi:hypothetical protein
LPWNYRYLVSLVGLLQKGIQVSHHPLKGIRHENQGSIGEDNKKFLGFSEILIGNNLIGYPVPARWQRRRQPSDSAATGTSLRVSAVQPMVMPMMGSNGLGYGTEHGCEVDIVNFHLLCFLGL